MNLPAEPIQPHVPNGPTVIILEDDARRAGAMIKIIGQVLPGYSSIVFVDSFGMIEWMKNHQQRIHLISLDHDLNDYRDASGKTRPAGTGRDGADFLSLRAPTCPIIIHSSNAPAALGMTEELRSAGWPIFRVYPHDDLQWIESDWADELRRLRDNGWLGEGLRSSTQQVRTSLR